jgi:phosphate transport system protein
MLPDDKRTAQTPEDAMAGNLEQSLQRDIDRIRDRIGEMSQRVGQALRDAVKALEERDHQRAYAVILRDQYIDEREKEIDRLILEFILRQQPVAGHLRFAYSAIKINADLERIGDYAESVARQALKFETPLPDPAKGRILELANLAIPMLHDAIRAFTERDAALARRTIEVEDTVDALRSRLLSELVRLHHDGHINYETLDPLAAVVRRLERASDQARDICMEVLYMCTGEYAKHPGSEVFRVLFVDQHNSCRSRLAEAVAQSQGLPDFIFSSAGLEPRPIDPVTAEFMAGKGFDLSHSPPKAVYQVPNLDHYQVIVILAPESKKVFPEQPQKVVYLDWSVADPSKQTGSPEEVRAAYEKTYQFILQHVRDLVQAIQGQNQSEPE